jgi:undecaprenyl-phosphate 4-deoxy-4-formamido-L-arabinose transferase
MKLISFVIPCYRSENSIKTVVFEIIDQFSGQEEFDYRIILVCDGSPDNTFGVIRSLCDNDKKITGLNLARNFGQQSARMAALPHVKGEYAIFMDDDGQHPAEGVFPLVKKLEEGFDIVYAHFKDKKHSFMQRIGSGINRIMTEFLIDKPGNVVASSFFAVRIFVLHELRQYHSPSPYLFGYLMKITRNIANIELSHRRRIAGESGYTFGKLLHLWMNGFTGFSVVPLRFSSFLGFLFSFFGFIFGLIIIIKKLLWPEIPAGYTSIIAILLFIGGIIMIMLGLLGEYIGRMFLVLNNLPQFVVREVLNEEV